MSKKSILSVLALAGDKVAAASVAAADLHGALFHLCHAGQATPLSDTFAALPNRGKAAKIRAVVSDYWQAAAAYRVATKRDGKLDKSGRFVGLQAANIPFSAADILADLSEAVAVVKKPKAEKADDKADEAAPNVARTVEDEEADKDMAAVAADAIEEGERLRTYAAMLQAENEALKAENEALKAELASFKAKRKPKETAVA